MEIPRKTPAWLLMLLMTLGAFCGAGCSRTPQQQEARFLERGKQVMKQGDYKRAILEFSNAVKIVPADPEAYYQLALAQLAAGETVSAARSLMRTTTLNPKHTAAQLKVAELLSADTEKAALEEAEKRIRVVLAESPNNPDALNVLAITEWRLGKKENSEDLLNQAFSHFPGNLKSTVNLAKLKLSQKDVTGAEQVLQKAIQSDPRSADLAVAFGNFYLAVDKPAQAEEQFRRALRIDPKLGPPLLSLASLKMRAGQMDEADRLYQQASALADPRLRPLHAMFLFQTGKRDAAIAEFEKLAKQDPADRYVRSRLVAAYEAVNRTSDAEKTLTSALRKNPQDAEALLQLSELELRSGRYVQAQADLAKILHLYPDSAVAHYLMGRVYQRRGATLSQRQEWNEAMRLDPRLLAVRSQVARLLISSNSAQAALDVLNEAPADQRNLPAVLVQKNWALLALGRLAEAGKGIEQALSLTKSPEVVLQDAALKVAQRDTAGARKSLEEALKRNPEDVAALDLLVRTYAVQKQMPLALEKVRGYVNQKPNSAPLQLFWARLLVGTADRAGARKAFTAAKNASRGFTGADLGLAQLDLTEGKLDSARNGLSAIVKSNPEDATARLMLASVEERAGNLPAAALQYRKVLEVNDQNVVALNNLAFLLTDLGPRVDEALTLAQKASELAPESAYVQDTLGWVLYRKGLYPSAIQYLEKAVSKEPTDRRKCHLALAYLKSGNQQRGREMLAAAVKMSPELLKESFLQDFLAEAGPQKK